MNLAAPTEAPPGAEMGTDTVVVKPSPAAPLPAAAEVTRLMLQLRQAKEEVARVEAQRVSPEFGSKTKPIG